MSMLVNSFEIASNVGTTFNPADKGANIVLSLANLKASDGGAMTGWEMVRSIAFHSVGKYYVEFVVVSQANFGICTLTATINGTGDYGLNGVDCFATGVIRYNNTNAFTLAVSGSNLKMAVDFDNKKLWIAAQGQTAWNAGGLCDPSIIASGYDISALCALGSLYLMAGIQPISTSEQMNTGSSSFNDTVPSGYIAGF